MNAIRIWAVGVNSFREIIRERILYAIGIFALIMVAAWQILPEVAVSAQGKMMLDLGLAVAQILGTVIAVFVGCNLINKEIDRKTILALIPKPVSRAELIIGRDGGGDDGNLFGNAVDRQNSLPSNAAHYLWLLFVSRTSGDGFGGTDVWLHD
jgi:ABC-2 family transporter protein